MRGKKGWSGGIVRSGRNEIRGGNFKETYVV